MKVIIVGATGFIGSAILRRAITREAITEIVTLSRRDLPAEYTKESKVKNVIVKDFNAYSDDNLAAMAGAELCIWALGGRVPQFPSYEEARNANVVYLHAGAKAMVEEVASSLPENKKFRFVYCSGMFTEYDQNKKLAFLEQSRKLKGEAEVGLIDVEKANPGRFELFIGRPAGVLETDKGLSNIIYGSMGIGKGELAAAMVDIGLNGAKSQVTESKDLRARGRELLKEP